MIQRYDPFGGLMSLRQMMDRLMEDAVVMPGGGQAGGTNRAALNVYEEGDNLVVEAQLAGVRPEDIDVSVERGMLTIRAENKADEERKDRSYIIREHRRGTFVNQLRLPDSVDPDAVQATFENGVLRLVFPRAEQAKPRRIQIGSGSSQSLSGGQQTGEQGSGRQAAASGASGSQGSGQQAGAASGAR
jgi:HSP20 family protein